MRGHSLALRPARAAGPHASSLTRREAHLRSEQGLWILAAGAVGFALAAFFSSALRLERSVFLVPYVLGCAAFLEAYRRSNRVDAIGAVRAHWRAGLLGGIAVGAFVVASVLRQPSSPPPVHAALAVAWLGLAYGTTDALMLSVLPVAAVWRATGANGADRTKAGRVAVGVLALAASLFVTAAYHLGYVEYRGAGLAGPLIGAGAMSVAYVVTRNPLAAVLSHVAMHVAAVLHGIDSTVQLPPHA